MIVRSPEVILGQMRDATIQAMTYVQGLTREHFVADLRTRDAVIMKLFVIGELSIKLIESGFIQPEESDIEWHKLRGMRNRIAHGYMDIDVEVVWQTTQTELPGLLSKLNALRS